MALLAKCLLIVLMYLTATRIILIPMGFHTQFVQLTKTCALVFIVYDLIRIGGSCLSSLASLVHSVSQCYIDMHDLVGEYCVLRCALYYEQLNQLVKHTVLYVITRCVRVACVELNYSKPTLFLLFLLSCYYLIHILSFTFIVTCNLIRAICNGYVSMYHYFT